MTNLRYCSKCFKLLSQLSNPIVLPSSHGHSTGSEKAFYYEFNLIEYGQLVGIIGKLYVMMLPQLL